MAFIAPIPLISVDAPAPSFLTSQLTRFRTSPHWIASVSPTPPEGRIHPNFPPRSRFRAPHIHLTSVANKDLYNRIDCSNAKVAIDIDWAREIRKQGQRGEAAVNRIVKGGGDFGLLFGGEVERGDVAEGNAVEKWFPKSRRYEVPIVEIKGPSDEGDEAGSQEYQLRLEIGTLAKVPDVQREMEQENGDEEGKAIVERRGAFWKKLVETPGMKNRTSVQEVVDRCFPRTYRNRAPIIEFASGELGVSLAMDVLEGGPKKEDYGKYFGDDKLFRGPEIKIQKPMGEWDHTSGYVEVSNVEVQLPVVRGASLKQRLLEAV